MSHSRIFASSCLILAASLMAGVSCGVSHPDGSGPGERFAQKRQGISIEEAARAQWSPVISLPIVPVSAANLPDGKVLLWSAENRFSFGSNLGRTYTVKFDPANNGATERLMSETGHDMFCPGTANLPDGRILVNGGLSSGVTSIYDPVSDTWTRAAAMNIPRAYEGTAPLADGSVFTLGGSWAGGVGNKHGEVWTEASGWRLLPGVHIEPFLSTDPTRNFGMDSHLWLLQTGNGQVFHAGPGFNMNWVDTRGNGRVTPIGRRGDDEFSINGNAVMFDKGKVLKIGGAPGYDGVNSNANSYVIELGVDVNVRKISPMAYRRAFHNSVVLPNGQVVVIGGATVAVGFSDNNSVLAPELFDPVTESFTVLPAMAVPRNYHSIALLLPDARVISAGGGLCGNGCAANHQNLQILSPPYLFNTDGSLATRPIIVTAPDSAAYGATMTVTTDSDIASFALMRSASTTHAVNNDQRRIPLSFQASGAGTYSVQVPTNPGWAVPGMYMLFAMNSAGVPSVAKPLRIGSVTALTLNAPTEQTASVGAPTSLPLVASASAGAVLSFGATGLPPGLSLDATSGLISGTPTTIGRTPVEVRVTDGQQTVSSELVWNIREPGLTRFVRFEARSEITGNPWSSAAEIDVLDRNGVPLPRTGFSISADSEEIAGQNGAAVNAIDGDPATIWQTQRNTIIPPPPHWLTLDLGASFDVGGLRYLPRSDGTLDGTVAQYAVYLSTDGVAWGSAVSEGTLLSFGPAADEKTIYFDNIARSKAATQSSTAFPADASRAVDGNTNAILANGSLTQTNVEPNPWWQVDLGAPYHLLGLRLWNRGDCCAASLSNFHVLTSKTPMTGHSLADLLDDPAVTKLQVPGTEPAVQLHTLSGVARFVRIQLAGTDALSLAEVEVYEKIAQNEAPTLATPVPGSLLVGTQATLGLEANDPDGDSLSFAATGLPPGLGVDPSTGVISGVATLAGSFHVAASVLDARGGTAQAEFDWNVGDVPPAVQPVVAPLAASGSTVTYNATATGSLLEYQWTFGDGSVATGFTSSPNVTHTFATPGVYTVTLVVRNPEGDAVSTEFVQGIFGTSVPGTPHSSSNLLEEPRPEGARVWSVNIDNDSVSVFERGALTRVREIPVGSRPRGIALGPDGRIWVSNKGSSTLSIIDPLTLSVAQTVSLPRASQPFGIVVGADGFAYVALEGSGRVVKLDRNGATVATGDVGANPRQLALTANGDRLLVSRFITAPQPGESTPAVETSVGGVKQGASVLILNPLTLLTTQSVVLQYSDKPDTTISGRGVPNYLGAPAISPDGQSAWVPSKQDNIQRGTRRDLQNLDFQNTVRAITSRIDLSAESEDYGARVDHDNSGLASAAVYDPSGIYLFVALETSRQVAVLDAGGKRELFRIEAGLAPEGLSVSADGHTLYVHNVLSRSVGVYDLGPLVDRGSRAISLLAQLATVEVEKLSPAVLRGKQLFYDARDTRLARDSYLSCASCHNDGGQDGRVWDLTGMGEGLRNTISLRGHAGAQGRLHWTANFDEVQDFEGQIRGLAQGTGLMSDADFNTGTRSQPLGEPKAGLSPDLDALAAYLGSLNTAEPSPYRSETGAMTSAASSGRDVFASQCITCHGGDDFTDSAALAFRNVGTLSPATGQRLGAAIPGLDTPTLRGSWGTAPYLHNGSAPTLDAAIASHTNLNLNATDLANVTAFVRELGSEEPKVSAPAGLLGQYFTNNALTGLAALTRSESVNFSWGAGSPAPGLPVNNFSARWSGQVLAPSSGTYRFQTNSDDGVRLWVNGAQVINNWTAHAATLNTSGNVTFVAGQRYDIKLEYQERSGNAVMQLRWRLPGQTAYVAIPVSQLSASGVGLTAQYFANAALTGTPVLARYEAPNFNWGTGAPGAAVPADNFSGRWVGTVSPLASGQYKFQTNSDDGVLLWVNGLLLIDNWSVHTVALDMSPAITLFADQRYDIKLEYNDVSGPALIQLNWLSPGATTYTSVPTNQLYPN